MKDYQVGVTAPPFHVSCRTTTVPLYEDFEGDANTRAARDIEDEYKEVEDISYPEWKEKYLIDRYGEERVEIQRQKAKNEVKDFDAYQEYKSVVNKKFMSDTFEKFQDLKYNNTVEYELLKVRYRIQTNGRIRQY